MNTIEERFAANLKRVRAVKGFSQEELAFRAALHRTQISLLEKGNRLPRFVTLIRLAGAAEVSPAVFMEGIEWKPIVTFTGGMVIKPADQGAVEQEPGT